MPDRYDEEARALLADGDDPAMAEARRLMDEPVHVAGPDDAEFERLVKAQHRAHDWSVPGQVNSVQRTEDARDVAGEGTRITEGMAARVVAKRQAKEDAKAIADEHFRRFIAAGDEYKRKGDWDRAGQFNSVEWARRYNENDPDSVEEMRQQVVQMQRGDPVNDISPWRAAIAQGAQVPAQLVNNIIAKVTGTPQRDIAPDMSEALAKDPVAEAVGGLTGGVGSMGLMGPVAKALGGGLKAWTAVGAGAGAASAPEGEELKGALRGGSANFLAAVGAGGLAKVLPGRAYIRLPAAGAAGGTGAEVVVDLATGERITGKRLAHALATNAVFSMNDLPVAARKEAAARFGALRTNLRTEQAASRDLNAYLDSKRPESPLGAAKPVDATQAGTENPTKPPPLSRALTKMEAGEVIAEAVGDGTVPLQDVVSKTVADGLKAGLPVQEALALPRPAGQDGYSPDTSNLDPAVKDLVDRTQAEIGPTVSSGTKPEPWALALDLKTGKPRRVTEADLAPQPDVAAPRPPGKAAGGDFDIDPATGLPNYLSHVQPSKPLKPGPMRRMDNPERGALDTSVVTAPLKGMADEVTTMAARVAKTDPELAKRIVAAPDQARRVAGRLSPAVERVYRAAGAFKEIGANPIGSGAKERKALADFERVPKSDWFKSPMVEQHEGRQAVSGVIPIATQRLSLARWKEAQRLGIMRENPETGVMEPLPDSNGKVFVRFSTPWRVDTMRNPGTANWNKLVRWHAEAEGIPVVEAEALLEAESTSMGLRAGTPLSKEASFEHRRFWKNVPAAGLVDGKVEPIYVTDPVEWAKKMSTEGAQRLGYASVMGQDFYVDSKTGKAVPGRTPVGDMRKDFIAKGGDPEVFDEAVRTAAGRPAIEPGRADTKGASVQRALDRIWHGLTRLRFSAVGLLNPAEPGGLANEQSGLGNTAAAALDAIGSGLYRLTGGRIAEGAFKRVSALVREGATPLERPSSQSYVNRTAAGASKRFVDQMRNGKIIDRARAAARLEATGIDYATARRMAEGKGTAAEYDAYARGATSRATGSGIGAVEKLRVENRGKLMRAAFTPLNYASRNIKQLYGTLKVVATAARSGNPNRIRAALQQTGTFALGRLATGTVQLAVMSLMTGGVQRLKDVIADYEDDPKGVGGRSLLQSMLSGPYGAFLRVTSGDADIGSVVMPVAIGRELVDAFTGGGFYEDMAFGDRMWKLTKSVAPIVKVGDTSVAMMAEAFGNPQHERQFIEAKRALGRWRRKHELAAGTWDRGDEDATFTRSMREVYKKIINKEDPWDAIMAMGKDRESIAASLMSRRALADPMLKGADPASGLSSESYALLKAHDEMLENLAYTVLNKARPAPRAEKVRKMNLPVDPRK